MDTSLFSIPGFQSFFLIFLRVGAIFMTAPLLGHKSVPSIWRIGLAGVMSFILLLGQGESPAPIPADLVHFSGAMLQEVALGLMIGFACRLVFEGIQMAGRMAGLQMSLGFASLLTASSSASRI